jgi:hypothetical protein
MGASKEEKRKKELLLEVSLHSSGQSGFTALRSKQ